MTGDMAAAHARDYRVKGLMDDAARALSAVVDDEDAYGRLGAKGRKHLHELRATLQRESKHVVAVWD